MKLAIISHTEHYTDSNGNIVGWGPTIREINYLSNHFEFIFHLACYLQSDPPKSSISYSSPNIKFIPLPAFGGRGMLQKLTVLTTAPSIISKLNDVIGEVDVLQLRLPTGMGNYILPYLSFKKNIPFIWVKYAGNWVEMNAPVGYRFQKWWLKNNFLKCPVTINGKWPNQPTHCLSFENPCIDEMEQQIGAKIITTKIFDTPLTGLFVGRLETWKGVDRIIDSLPILFDKGFKTFHFVGGGEKLPYYKNLVIKLNLPMEVVFHDFLSRDKISQLFIDSHVIFLPSDNEGFPKVIAEAANYGCVPIVSNVSSIPYYINESNGFLWNINDVLFQDFIKSIDFFPEILLSKSKQAFIMSKLFSFGRYAHEIINLLKVNSIIK
jgi:glycosyltransferase involved in cell wall biosynthesis